MSESSALVDKLKREIHRLKKENKKLYSKIRSYDKAFAKNIKLIKNKTEEFSLDELIYAANRELSLDELKEAQHKNMTLEEWGKEND